MGFALLFLGLMPLMFMSDVFFGGDADAGESDDKDDDHNTPRDGNFLDGFDSGTDTGGTNPDDNALLPDTGNDDPTDGDDVDPDDVLGPDMGDDEPVEGDEVDPDSVADPDDEPGEEFAIDGDGSLLQQLLVSESDFDTGTGFVGTQIGETSDISLGDGDNLFTGLDDDIAGNGDGEMDDRDGTPVVTGTDPIDVIDGGDGADEITLGDAAAYAFGGAGDDTLAAGDGTGALFGGEGDDTLSGTNTGETAWLDGGLGDDTLIGGDADEVLVGGAHWAGSDAEQDDDTIDGGGGDDDIRGGFGADTLSGGDGDDVIDHLGRAEEDVGWQREAFSWHVDNDADTLDGGDGNDTLIMDRADSATGGAGMDTFWVYFDDASGAGAAEIGDFNVGEDFLRVTLNPELGLDDPEVSVGPSEDGQDGVVTVNGETVAILRGAAGATTADVYAEVVPDVFVA